MDLTTVQGWVVMGWLMTRVWEVMNDYGQKWRVNSEERVGDGLFLVVENS